jgi:hypothetical protein
LTRVAVLFASIILVAFVAFFIHYENDRDIYIVGSIVTRDGDNVITLTNSQEGITGGNYDTWTFPQGTAYQVPTGKTLILGYLGGIPDSSPNTTFHLRIGYGDDDVADSASPPTNAVFLWNVSIDASVAAVPINRDLPPISIPAGKYPWIKADNDYNLVVSGVLK